MKYCKVMKTSYIFLLIVCLSVFPNMMAQKKSDKKELLVNVQLTVKDDAGSPLPSAMIVVGEGEKYYNTNKDGQVSFEAPDNEIIKIASKGYEDVYVTTSKVAAEKIIQLKKQLIHATDDDLMPYPFITLKKRNISGSSVLIKGEELEKYQGTDIRNAFTGLAVGLDVREMSGEPGMNVYERYGGNEKVNLDIRGRQPLYIIDGMQAYITEMHLDPSEIESATIIKDVVGKAMYGATAADGIILITTVQGKKNEKRINVNFEKGVSIVDRMPRWANGSEYARLNNMARINSGLPVLFSDDAISQYGVNDGYNMYYPNNDYRSMMFNNTMSYHRANVSSSGGNENVRYFSYLGYSGEGDLFKIGNTSNYNRLLSRSNINIKINDFMKVHFGIYGAISLRNSPNYANGTEYLQFESALSDANRTPPVEFPIYANNSSELEKPWYAVSNNYGTNPIGALSGRGFYFETGRTGSSNLKFDLDMSHLIPGLSSESYVGFSLFNQVRLGKVEDYSAYIVTPGKTSADEDTITLTKVHDGKDEADLSKLSDFYFQRFLVSQTFKHNARIGKVGLQNSLTYLASKLSRDGAEESQRQQNFIWSAIAEIDNKYFLQVVVNYAGTYSFLPENRYRAFPSLGASWVISEEDFMSGNSVIDYLKLRAEAGILGYDNYQSPYYYRDDHNTSTSGISFGPYSAGTWFGTTTENAVPKTTQSRTGNPSLSWEVRKELNVGFDGSFLKNKLEVELTYYNFLRNGIISQVQNVIPALVGLTSFPKLNYNDIRYYGVEAGLYYTDKIGDFSYRIGGNASWQKTRYEKIDEPNYRFDYQSRLGQPIDTYYGLKYLGVFQTKEETLETPQLFDNELFPGDLKYTDMNKDGVIDDNDKTALGNTTPRLLYAINFNLKYKSFELSMIGTGRAFYHIALTNSYYWNGWGDGNYSDFVKNNVGGAYPRLTYNKVNNNFIGSDFWLTRGDFFKIQHIEFNYTLPKGLIGKLGLREARIFIKGANLHTFSKIKDVDPESINSGVSSYPLFMNLTSGFKLTF